MGCRMGNENHMTLKEHISARLMMIQFATEMEDAEGAALALREFRHFDPEDQAYKYLWDKLPPQLKEKAESLFLDRVKNVDDFLIKEEDSDEKGV